MDWSTYTNTELLAVVTSGLSTDDLQTYREELNRRGLSSTPPAIVPSTPGPSSTPVASGSSPSGNGWVLTFDDDGAVRTTAV